jgi:hypothetical protein
MILSPEIEIRVQRKPEGGYVLSGDYREPGLHIPIEELETIDIEPRDAKLLADRVQIEAYSKILSERIFDSLERKTFWQRVQNRAGNDPVRLRLWVPDELQNLIWERLSDPSGSQFLALSQKIIMSRYFADKQSHKLPSPPKKLDLKALLIIANPKDIEEYKLSKIEVSGEVARLRKSLEPIPLSVVGGEYEQAYALYATPAAIKAALDEDPSIVIIMCHGTQQQDGWHLILEDDHGNSRRISSATLVQMVQANTRPPHIMILASCESAGDGYDYSRTEPSIATELMRCGVSAVLGFQDKISILGVQRFLTRFFTVLQNDRRIDLAVAKSRWELSGSGELGDSGEWWQPVLWLRSESGYLWDEPKYEQKQITTLPPSHANVLWNSVDILSSDIPITLLYATLGSGTRQLGHVIRQHLKAKIGSSLRVIEVGNAESALNLTETGRLLTLAVQHARIGAVPKFVAPKIKLHYPPKPFLERLDPFINDLCKLLDEASAIHPILLLINLVPMDNDAREFIIRLTNCLTSVKVILLSDRPLPENQPIVVEQFVPPLTSDELKEVARKRNHILTDAASTHLHTLSQGLEEAAIAILKLIERRGQGKSVNEAIMELNFDRSSVDVGEILFTLLTPSQQHVAEIDALLTTYGTPIAYGKSTVSLGLKELVAQQNIPIQVRDREKEVAHYEKFKESFGNSLLLLWQAALVRLQAQPYYHRLCEIIASSAAENEDFLIEAQYRALLHDWQSAWILLQKLAETPALIYTERARQLLKLTQEVVKAPMPSDGDRSLLYRLIGDCARYLGETDIAYDAYVQAYDSWQHGGDEERSFLLALQILLLLETNSKERNTDRIEELVAPAIDKSPLAALIRSFQGIKYLQSGQTQKAETILREAVTIFETSGALTSNKRELFRHYYGWIGGYLGQALDMQGRSDEAITEMNRLLTQMKGFEKDVDQIVVARIKNNLGIAYQARGIHGDDARARRAYEESIEIRRRVGDRSTLHRPLTNLADFIRDTAKDHETWKEAEKYYQEVLPLARRAKDPEAMISMLNVTSLYIRQGRWEEAEAIFVEFDTRSAYTTTVTSERRYLNHAWLAIERQQPEEATQQLGKLENDLHEIDIRLFYEWVQLNLENSLLFEKEINTTKLSELLTEVLQESDTKSNKADWTYARGLLHFAEGQTEQAVHTLTEAGDLFKALGYLYMAAHVSLWIARLHARYGQRANATQACDKSIKLLRPFGDDVPLLQKAHALRAAMEA